MAAVVLVMAAALEQRRPRDGHLQGERQYRLVIPKQDVGGDMWKAADRGVVFRAMTHEEFFPTMARVSLSAFVQIVHVSKTAGKRRLHLWDYICSDLDVVSTIPCCD